MMSLASNSWHAAPTPQSGIPDAKASNFALFPAPAAKHQFQRRNPHFR
jgi:hypothetical protein